MFWNDEDLAELQGTCVVGWFTTHFVSLTLSLILYFIEKLGRDQAEKDYNDKVLPAVNVCTIFRCELQCLIQRVPFIQSRPDLFVSSDILTRYSLSTYHLMGSRILSRSFTIEITDDARQHAGDMDAGNTSIVSSGSAMDVDEPKPADGNSCENDHHPDHHAPEPGRDDQAEHGQEGEGEEGGESDEEEEVAAEVVMIPLADILNARYQSENVRLFYEPDCLKMVSTKPIKAGEQIVRTFLSDTRCGMD